MEEAQVEMRPHMDNVLKDVSNGRSSLHDVTDKSSVFSMTSSQHEVSPGVSHQLQKLLDVMSYVPERVASFEGGKYVTQRNGLVSYIYAANKS